jgi:hypothetical protein
MAKVNIPRYRFVPVIAWVAISIAISLLRADDIARKPQSDLV